MTLIDELKEIFTTVFGNELNVSGLCEQSDLRKDLGMNSVHLLYMAMVLEEKYSIRFDNSDFEKINKVQDVINKIEGTL